MRSLPNSVLHASDGMVQPPRGDRLTEPTAGPSGMHERLNCWLKKRRTNVFSHFMMVASSYVDAKAFFAMKKILSGEYP